MSSRTSRDYIPREFIEDAVGRTDIVELISEYVPLRRRGRDYKGLCPFHSEKTPSFSVNQERQIFYCFGCHAGGNALTFLMKKENLPFLDALRILAGRLGMELPAKELTEAERAKEEKHRRWREVHARAAQYFQDVLDRPEGTAGRQYLRNRGIDEDLSQTFGLGYATDNWSGLLQEMKGQGITPRELEEVGLAVPRSDAQPGTPTHYDRFRNRVMFTIRDAQARPIAFGGRVIDNAVPKYLNSPETMFFNKGKNLYAIDLAARSIREKGYALLVEGYMDVITAHKMGFSTAVASLGTALTKDQAKLLKRFTTKVIICYDSDNAGVQATLRAGEIILEEQLDVLVLTLQKAKDPDEFFKKYSAEDFQRNLQDALPFLEYKYRILAAEEPPQTASAKAAIIQKIAPDILKIASSVGRESYERYVARELGITFEAVHEEILRIEIKRRETKKNRLRKEDFSLSQDISVRNRNTTEENALDRTPGRGSTLIPDRQETAYTYGPYLRPGIFRAEQLILRILIENPALSSQVIVRFGSDFWQIPEHSTIFDSLAAGTITKLAHQTTDILYPVDGREYEEIQKRMAEIYAIEFTAGKEEEMLEDCLNLIAENRRKDEIKDLQTAAIDLEKSGDITGAMKILQQIGERLHRDEK